MKLTREPEWISILETREEYLIRIKHMSLIDAEIPAIIFDQRDSSYNAFGYMYLKVRSEDVDKARKLLNLENE